MARQNVQFTRNYTHVIPETVIEVFNAAGELQHTIPTPEKRFNYSTGQIVTFKSKKDAKAFVDAHESGVCIFI